VDELLTVADVASILKLVQRHALTTYENNELNRRTGRRRRTGDVSRDVSCGGVSRRPRLIGRGLPGGSRKGAAARRPRAG